MDGRRDMLREARNVPLQQYPDLAQSPVAMDKMLAAARDGLFRLVDSLPGDKCLVFDPAVAGPLKLVLVEGSNTLKSHGVVDVLELNWADLEVSCETVLYIIRPESKMALQIASQVKNAGRRHRYQVHFVPKRSFLCDELLRQSGVMDLLSENDLFEYNLGFVPYDTDVLSLGLDSSYAQVALKGDDSSLMYSARALLQLQDILGPIPHMQFKGDHSRKVLEMMLRLRLEATEVSASEALERDAAGFASESDADSDDDAGDQHVNGVSGTGELSATLLSDIRFTAAHGGANPGAAEGGPGDRVLPGQVDTLLLIDRNLDLVTPMVTGLTYEALVDSLVGIRNGHATVDSELVDGGLVQGGGLPGILGAGGGGAASRKPKTTISLNSKDRIFAKVRGMHIGEAMSELNEVSKELKERQDSRNRKDESSGKVQDLSDYVANKLINDIIDTQLVPRHINIVRRLRDTAFSLAFRKMWKVEHEMLVGENHLAYIEECIARQEPWPRVLQLACLQSLACNGLASADFDKLRTSIVHNYGFELMFTLDNLERVNMLRRRSGRATWPEITRKFRLQVPEVDAASPTDIAFVTSGYAPLSVRVVEEAIEPGWAKVADKLALLPGRIAVRAKQPGRKFATADESSNVTKRGRRKVMVVFFTGGVTFTEIAALRFLSSQPECPFEIVVASTSIVNGKTLLNSIAHEMENRTR